MNRRVGPFGVENHTTGVEFRGKDSRRGHMHGIGGPLFRPVVVVALQPKRLGGRVLHARLQMIRDSGYCFVGSLAHTAFGSPHDIHQAVIPNGVQVFMRRFRWAGGVREKQQYIPSAIVLAMLFGDLGGSVSMVG